MSAPFILITSHRALDGRESDLRASAEAYTTFVAESEPGLAALTAALDTEQSTVTFAHVFTTASAADEHLTTAAEHITASFAVTRTSRIEVFGDPGPAISALLNANRDADVPVTSMGAAGGFLRD